MSLLCESCLWGDWNWGGGGCQAPLDSTKPVRADSMCMAKHLCRPPKNKYNSNHVPLPACLPLPLLPRCVVSACHSFCCYPPHSGAFIGLIGSVAFYPLAVYFPIKMFSAIYSPTQLQLSIMLAVNVLTAVLSVAAAAGSLADIVRSADTQYSVG